MSARKKLNQSRLRWLLRSGAAALALDRSAASGSARPPSSNPAATDGESVDRIQGLRRRGGSGVGFGRMHQATGVPLTRFVSLRSVSDRHPSCPDRSRTGGPVLGCARETHVPKLSDFEKPNL